MAERWVTASVLSSRGVAIASKKVSWRAFGAVLAAVASLTLAQSASAAAAQGFTLVELRPGAACSAAVTLHRAGATTVSSELLLYRLDAGAAAKVLPGLRASGAVRLTTPDRAAAGTLSVTDFTDPLSSHEWWRAAIGVADLTPPGPGKPITIIDSGIDVAHPEFAGWAELLALNPQEPQPIGGVHGTAVASVVGAPVNGVGVVGIYPHAIVQSWDSAIGQGTSLASSGIVAGVLAAASRGPGVINLSLGGTQNETIIHQAIAKAIGKGLLVVAAAGNDGERRSPLTYPASQPHVLTVAATDEQNQVASFSSRSRFVDLAAPGVNIMVATALDHAWDVQDGTSFAAPLVSGAAAWVWTLRPDLDASQLFEVMRKSATDIDLPGPDVNAGYGLLNIPAALAFQAPIKDPLEPNDDLEYVRPGGLFYNGNPVLTSKAKPAASVAARLSIFEDPRDVYPVFVPKKGMITVRTAGAAAVDLALWSSTAPSVTQGNASRTRLALGVTRGSVETVTYKNPGAARTAYLAVSLGKGNREATYSVTVAAK